MSMKAASFGWVDYLVFALLLLISCGTGVYYTFYGNKKQNLEEYLMADRKMFVIPTGVSTVVTLLNSVLILGVPAEIYVYGTEFWIYGFGIILAFVITAVIFVPLLHPLKLTSSYKYLELRFQSKTVKLTGSFLLIISQIFDMGITFFGPATALEGVSGFPAWGSILSFGFVATFYTALGGIKAVIWADTIQAVIILGGLIGILSVGSNEVGGMENIWKLNQSGGRLRFFNFSVDPTIRHTFWSLLVGGIFSWLPRTAVNQASVQRFLMVPSLKKGKLTVLLALPGIFILFTICCLCGMVMYAYFADCDPLSNPNLQERLGNSNQLIPYFVMQVLGWPGVPGIFLAVLYSLTLSTISSILNALSTVIWEDILQPCLPKLSERGKMILIKILVVLTGIVGIGMSFLVKSLGGILVQLAISLSSGTLSPLLGMFVLGGMFPCCNWLGAVIGGIAGLSLSLWMNFGAYFAVKLYHPKLKTSVSGCMLANTVVNSTTIPSFNSTTISSFIENVNYTELSLPITTIAELKGIEKIYGVSYMLIPLIGLATTVLVGLLISLISGPFIKAQKFSEVDRRYLMSMCHCFLPASNKYQLNENFETIDQNIPISESDKEKPDTQEIGVL